MHIMLSLHLTALGPIRKLPPFHGAHWSSCFRFLLRPYLGGADPGDVWVVPEADTPAVIERGDQVRIGLVFPQELAGAVSAALAGFNSSPPGSGHFQPGVTVRLDRVVCRVGGGSWNPLHPAVLTEDLLRPEVEMLCGLDRFTLRLETPLRLTRPAGNKEEGHRYCDAAFFTTGSLSDGEKIAAITNRVRGGGDGPVGSPLRLAGGALDWRDVTYGTGFKKTIGGIVGEIVLAGRCDSPTAARLVIGQYLGAGKNAAFGFGFYTIPELDPVRRVAPLAGGVTVDLASPDNAVWGGENGLTIAYGDGGRELFSWEIIERVLVDPSCPPPPAVVSMIIRREIPLLATEG